MKIINTEKIPIKMWLEEIEEGALNQAKNLANLPFAYRWIALMPDAHVGFGMPIGGVLATKDVIIPNSVGVDIGCGMGAVKTSLTEIDTEELKKIMAGIRKLIPVGFEHHKKAQCRTPKLTAELPVVERELTSADKQIGTLGGGNHFIEIQKGDDGYIWVMVHSGSRNLGLQVAKHYNNLAIKLSNKWSTQVPGEWDLAYLPVDTKEGADYLNEMQYCVDFALANRQLMMNRIMELFPHCNFEPMINIAHNYASLEEHFGKKVYVHRKGATKANPGLTGIIPGSMGTSSYIIEGLGNPESFMSCAHGAGRKIGRQQAIRSLNLEEEQNKMKGILGGPRNRQELEEAPGAYKPIDEVMANQADLVKIKVKLTPLANIKG